MPAFAVFSAEGEGLSWERRRLTLETDEVLTTNWLLSDNSSRFFSIALDALSVRWEKVQFLPNLHLPCRLAIAHPSRNMRYKTITGELRAPSFRQCSRMWRGAHFSASDKS